MCKVSIIMAEYNTPTEYLHASIRSILNQTFRDFELLIIDDCGTNDLQAIAHEYNDDRLHIIKNDKNRGLVYSLNKAIRQARGKYLVRMDTDDLAEPTRVEALYGFATNHPEYVVVGSRAIEFSNSGDGGILGRSGEKTSKQLISGDTPIHPSVIMVKKIITDIGGYPNYRRAEDFALWCELALSGARIYVLEDILLRYRVNDKDYSKRSIKHRMGEIRAKLHYSKKMNLRVRGYVYVARSIVAGILPIVVVARYRKKKLARKDR